MQGIAPALAQLLDLAGRPSEVTPGALQEAFARALTFNRESRHMLELTACAVLRTRALHEVLRQARAELEAQESNIHKLREALAENRALGAAEACRQIEDTARRMLDLSLQLRWLEEKEAIYSPFPELDFFIKTGINVLNGHLDPVEVESRFPQLTALVGAQKLDLERFERLYDRPDLVAEARPALEQMQAGLGGVVEFIRSNSGEALVDGMKLLGGGSVGLAAVFERMQEHAAAGARLPEIEELRRARVRLDPAREGELLAYLWRRLEQAFYHYEGELNAVRRLNLFPLLEGEFQVAWLAVQALGSELTRAAEIHLKQPAEVDLEALERGFQALRDGMEGIWKRLEQEASRYQDAPGFGQLRELVFQVLHQGVSAGLLTRELQRLQELGKELAAEVGSREMGQLLVTQGEAMEAMLTALEQKMPDRLRAGWEQVEACLPRLMEVHREMRAGMGLSERPESAPSSVACFRCGTPNPPNQGFCQNCKAVLGAASQAPPEYTDIVGGEESSGGVTGGHVARLEQLVERVLAGESGPNEVLAEVDAQLDRAEAIARQFDAQVLPTAHKDETVAAYAEFFEGRMHEFMEGLLTMREFAESGGLGSLQNGLAACQAAGSDLLAMKARIDRSLRRSS